jgi:hypothetical protein
LEDALGNLLGYGSGNTEMTNWDRFNVEAPSSQQASFGRPSGAEYSATVAQAIGYDIILWNSGNLESFNFTQEDANIMIPVLTLLEAGEGFDKRFYASGDGFVNSPTQEAATEPDALLFLNQWLGVEVECATVRNEDCPIGTAKDTVTCIDLLDADGGGRTVDGTPARSVVHLGQGNGCPQERSFDVISVSGSAAGSPLGEENYDGPVKGNVPSSVVTNEVTGGPDYQSVVDGLSVHYRRDETDCLFSAPPQTAVEERLDEVLSWFGVNASCRDPFAGLPAPDVTPSKFKTALSNFAPNPLRQGSGRITFTMAHSGRASIQIYDVGGRLVNQVFDGLAGEGLNTVHWDGTDQSGREVASGVYFYRLKADQKEFAQKMVVVRLGSD